MTRLTVLFFLLIQHLSAQTAKGIVISVKGEPLPYAHVVGSKTREIAITNEKGEFELLNLLSDTLFVSMVGYADTFIVVSSKNTAFLKVTMLEKKYILNEFIVNPNNAKYKKQIKSLESLKSKAHYTRYLYLSGRIVQKFLNPYGFDGKIEQVKFNIKSTEYDAIVRIRVYTIEGSLPGENILSENVLLSVRKGSSKLVFDLSEKVVPFPKQGCYIGIDVVNGEDKRVGIGFRGFRVGQDGLSLVSNSGRNWIVDNKRGTYASYDIDVKASIYFPRN
jgi:hypothetical protein